MTAAVAANNAAGTYFGVFPKYFITLPMNLCY